ncbi:hypothetical protein [Pseudomonas viridiflava]|uniref:hypothetical protein n=1 Tax=Pseudomonas viridiflava TaxID=33069 RepID=UPI0013CE6FA9|nr:hypothetical protein [Pseudomonas viridiflava]MCQ9391922.1 hypothetical protein [Pseudomonas viridiflava]
MNHAGIKNFAFKSCALGRGETHDFVRGIQRPLMADSVEKIDLLLGLRQDQVIGQREDSQHYGTIVERTRETVLLVQH